MENKCCQESAQALSLISAICYYDYDGYSTVESLKSLIDEIKEIADNQLK